MILDVNKKSRSEVAKQRIGERSRQEILSSPERQAYLRKHIAYGFPMRYIAWEFQLTIPQAWSLVRELEII